MIWMQRGHSHQGAPPHGRVANTVRQRPILSSSRPTLTPNLSKIVLDQSSMSRSSAAIIEIFGTSCTCDCDCQGKPSRDIAQSSSRIVASRSQSESIGAFFGMTYSSCMHLQYAESRRNADIPHSCEQLQQVILYW